MVESGGEPSEAERVFWILRGLGAELVAVEDAFRARETLESFGARWEEIDDRFRLGRLEPVVALQGLSAASYHGLVARAAHEAVCCLDRTEGDDHGLRGFHAICECFRDPADSLRILNGLRMEARERARCKTLTGGAARTANVESDSLRLSGNYRLQDIEAAVAEMRLSRMWEDERGRSLIAAELGLRPPDLVTVAEASERLGYPERSIRNWIEKGDRLEHVDTNGGPRRCARRYRLSDIERRIPER